MKKNASPESRVHRRFAVLAADVALFTLRDNQLYVRMMAVHRPPHFPEARGLPGGLIDAKETAEDTAKRLMKTRARVNPTHVHLEQLYTFSRIDRDPRARVVSVGYLGLAPWGSLSESEQADTVDAWWEKASTPGHLAYDHDELLALALQRLRSRIHYTTLIGKLMPQEFTLTELELSYEHILKTALDKRNFRKKILKLKILKPLQKKRAGGRSRPAQLYRFLSPKVSEIEVI